MITLAARTDVKPRTAAGIWSCRCCGITPWLTDCAQIRSRLRRLGPVQGGGIGGQARAEQRVVERRVDARRRLRLAELRGQARHRDRARVPAGLAGQVTDVLPPAVLLKPRERARVKRHQVRGQRLVLAGQPSGPGRDDHVEPDHGLRVITDRGTGGDASVHHHLHLQVRRGLVPRRQYLHRDRRAQQEAAAPVGGPVGERHVTAHVLVDEPQDQSEHRWRTADCSADRVPGRVHGFRHGRARVFRRARGDRYRRKRLGGLLRQRRGRWFHHRARLGRLEPRDEIAEPHQVTWLQDARPCEPLTVDERHVGRPQVADRHLTGRADGYQRLPPAYISVLEHEIRRGSPPDNHLRHGQCQYPPSLLSRLDHDKPCLACIVCGHL